MRKYARAKIPGIGMVHPVNFGNHITYKTLTLESVSLSNQTLLLTGYG